MSLYLFFIVTLIVAFLLHKCVYQLTVFLCMKEMKNLFNRSFIESLLQDNSDLFDQFCKETLLKFVEKIKKSIPMAKVVFQGKMGEEILHKAQEQIHEELPTFSQSVEKRVNNSFSQCDLLKVSFVKKAQKVLFLALFSSYLIGCLIAYLLL